MNVDPRFRATGAKVTKNAPKPAHSSGNSNPPPVISPLEILLSLEGDIRAITSHDALCHFMCNETRKLVRCGQAMYFQSGYRKKRWQLAFSSSVSSVDRNAPAVRALEAQLGNLAVLEKPENIEIDAAVQSAGLQLSNGLALPVLSPNGQTLGLLLLLRNEAFVPQEEVLLTRLVGAYGHALSFFSKAKKRAKRAQRWRIGVLASALLIGAAMFVPVPMSILAPVEVVARDPQIVTSPMDGVIADIGVDPNNPVNSGQLLVQFNDTDLVGRLEVTERNLEVAAARYRRAQQGASLSADMRREMAITQSELAVAQAERDEAKAAYERTQVFAPSDGLAIFASRDEWLGRPVATGERIMEIGDPEKLEFRVDVGLGDSIVLGEDASVRVFLHNDPLSPIDAKFIDAGFRAEESEDSRLVYRVKAHLTEDADTQGLRIGLRGTARVSAGSVSLGYYLFRKPISTFRQWTGI